MFIIHNAGPCPRTYSNLFNRTGDAGWGVLIWVGVVNILFTRKCELLASRYLPSCSKYIQNYFGRIYLNKFEYVLYSDISHFGIQFYFAHTKLNDFYRQGKSFMSCTQPCQASRHSSCFIILA